MLKALHPRDDTDRLYVPRKEGGRGLVTIQDRLDASIHRLEDNIKKGKGRWITATRNNTDNTRIKRTTITRKQKMGRKTTVWPFQAINKRNLTRENLDVAMKRKRFERNRISSDSNTKQRHGDSLYQSKNRKDTKNSKYRL